MASKRKLNDAEPNDELIQQFCAVTGVDSLMAKYFLEACNCDLELAIGMHMDSGASESAVGCDNQASASAAGSSYSRRLTSDQINIDEGSNSSSATFDDDVRAPIPQRLQVLVEDSFVPVRHLRRRKPRTVFDGFRDFQAESSHLHIPGSRDNGESSSSSGGVSTAANRKLRTLEELFRPPIDLLHKGTFRMACETGSARNKWLMVNVQNTQEFACQSLNRDLWSSSHVKEIVREHFVFWQVYSDSEEGLRYMQFYKVAQWPYISVLDPRTGECMVVWNKVDAKSFEQVVSEFLSQHFVPDASREVCVQSGSDGGGGQESSVKNNNNNKEKRRRLDSETILDASEEMQLQTALRASANECLTTSAVSYAQSSRSTAGQTGRQTGGRTADESISDSSSDDEELETFSASSDDDDDDDDVCRSGKHSNRLPTQSKHTTVGNSTSASFTTNHSKALASDHRASSNHSSGSSKGRMGKACTMEGATESHSGLIDDHPMSKYEACSKQKMSRTDTASSSLSSLSSATSSPVSSAHSQAGRAVGKVADSGCSVEPRCGSLEAKTSGIGSGASGLTSIGGDRSTVGSTDRSTASSSVPPPLRHQAASCSWRDYLGPDTDPLCTILLKFANGERHQMKLPSSSQLKALVLYAETEHGYSSETYEMLTTFPQRKLSALDMRSTLQAIGLCPQATVFVQERAPHTTAAS